MFMLTSQSEAEKTVNRYLEMAYAQYDERIKLWSYSTCDPVPDNVQLGLMSRQYRLGIELARNPTFWSPHLAPLVLRAMAEVHIMLSWIVGDVQERAKMYVLDGLGKEKLILAHRADELKQSGQDVESDLLIRAGSAWIESQRYESMVDVNLGNWTGMDLRKVAKEAGCLDFYRYVYPVFSSATHSSWNHVSRFDMQVCNNPLHGMHYVPSRESVQLSADYLRLAAKYLDKTLVLIADQIDADLETESAYEWLCEACPDEFDAEFDENGPASNASQESNASD